MKFGIPEIKKFAENHEDERVRIMYARLCKARSDNARWCEAAKAAKDERDEAIAMIDVVLYLLANPPFKK